MIVVLWLFFVILNGRWDMDVLLSGGAAAGIGFAFACAFLNWSFRKEWTLYKRVPGFILYRAWRVGEIVKANIATLKKIYSRREVEPEIVTFHTPMEEEWQRALLANSITLTPGTITLHSEKGRLVVHCLDREFSQGLEGSAFEKRIRKLGEIK